jgi:hypothetical protein
VGYNWLGAVLASALFAGTGVAQEAGRLPKGPAPWLLTVAKIGDDQVELKRESSSLQAYRPAIKGLDILDAGGNRLTEWEFRKRVAVGSTVVVSSDGNAVDPSYLKVLREDAVVLVGVVARTAPTRRVGSGHIADDRREREKPEGGLITSKEDFARLVKAWTLREPDPAIDFDKEVVVVVTSKEYIGRIDLVGEKGKGDVRVAVEFLGKMVAAGGGEVGGFQWKMAVFPRAGITAIDGRSLARGK